MWWSAAISWVTGPFKKFLSGIPKEVWYVLLAAFGIVLIRADARRDGIKEGEAKSDKKFEKAKAKAEREAITFTEEKTKEAINNANDAIKARDNASATIDYDSMSDEEYFNIFGYHKTPDQYS